LRSSSSDFSPARRRRPLWSEGTTPFALGGGYACASSDVARAYWWRRRSYQFKLKLQSIFSRTLGRSRARPAVRNVRLNVDSSRRSNGSNAQKPDIRRRRGDVSNRPVAAPFGQGFGFRNSKTSQRSWRRASSDVYPAQTKDRMLASQPCY
jgi:hypothetical protein